MGRHALSARARRSRSAANEAAEVNVLALIAVLMLNASEFWRPLTPWDTWHADYMAQGVLIALAPFWARHWAAATVAVIFGIARTGCAALWPEASDPNGSICDRQTGLPITVGLLAAALWALERIRNRG